MSIRAVSSVSFTNNYNRTNFTGKKQNNSVSNNISVKVPIAAALFAMTVPNAQAIKNIYGDAESSVNKTEMVATPQDEKIIAIATESKGIITGYKSNDGLKKSDPIYGECQIQFISTDGNATDAEAVRLYAKINRNGRISDSNHNLVKVNYTETRLVNVNTLYTYNITDNNGKILSTSYYFLGKGVTQISPKIDSNGNALSKATQVSQDEDKVEVSKDCFDRLKKVMGNSANCKTETVKESELYDEISKALLDLFGL